MCCVMQITTNFASLMDEAIRLWSEDTYHPSGPYQALKEKGVTLEAELGAAHAVFSLTGIGHDTSPESWVAAVKGVVTLYNWGLKLNQPDPDVARWTLEHLGEPCEQRVVADSGHPVDLTLFCRGGAPMGLGKAEAAVIDEHNERHGADECICGCNDNCGAETVGPNWREV